VWTLAGSFFPLDFELHNLNQAEDSQICGDLLAIRRWFRYSVARSITGFSST
jgi:hypothetical protein